MEKCRRELEDLVELIPSLSLECSESEIKILKYGKSFAFLNSKKWTNYDGSTSTGIVTRVVDGRLCYSSSMADVLSFLNISPLQVAKDINKTVNDELEELNKILPLGLQVGTDGNPIEVIRKIRLVLRDHFENVPDSDAYFDAKSHFES